MNNEILRTLDALAISTFVDSGTHLERDGNTSAEVYFKRAVRAAETVFGPYHGEVGFVLLQLASYYERHGRHDEAVQIEQRIGEIVSVYRCDQES